MSVPLAWCPARLFLGGCKRPPHWMAQALEASEPSVPSATSTPAFLTVFLAAWRDMVGYERGVWASPYYVIQ